MSLLLILKNVKVLNITSLTSVRKFVQVMANNKCEWF